MKIYLLRRDDLSRYYDETVACVVIAENRVAARHVAQAEFAGELGEEATVWLAPTCQVTLIGTTDTCTVGVVLADYRSG